MVGKAVVAIAGTALFFGLPSALAQTREQSNAIKHIVTAQLVSEHCPYLQMNNDLMLLTILAHKLHEGDPKNGPIARAMRGARVKAEDDAKPMIRDEAAMCVFGLIAYGPEGGNVPRLLLKKP